MSTPPRRPPVLFVDDDPNVLAAYAVTLRRRFDVTTAVGGPEGLAAIAKKQFVAIVSDFQMPEMDGAEFLARAKEVAPDAIRILLTGHASLDRALQAVNRGYIFRFLSKPCTPSDLTKALDDAVEQTRLVSADRVLLERKLAATSQQLLRAERLATLGTLAGAIGHELNNVLVPLSGSLEFIAERARSGQAPEDEDLRTLQVVREHLLTHARNLLDLGRPKQRGAAMSTDLARVIRDTVAMLRSAGFLRGVDVRIEAPPEPIHVALDRTPAEQLVLNLVKNALDALGDREAKTLVIELDVDAGNMATVQIRDNGAGIAAENLRAIFDPYFTTKSQESGTGLGLFVVKQILESNAGTLDVESDAGAGTTVTFRLPYHLPECPSVAPRAERVA